MNKFQKLSFGNVKEFLDYLPEDERELVEILRRLIGEWMPGSNEKLAYNVPFYYGFGRILFLWPGSVPWGGLRTPGVQIGFCKGNLLPSRELLNQGNRKEVYTLQVQVPEDIDVELLRMLVLEAVEVDREAQEKKRKGVVRK